MDTLICNLNVVNIATGTITPDVSLLISDGIVARIGQIEPSDNVRLFDAKKYWAIPSFIDMHAHVTFDGRAHYHLFPAFRFDENDTLSLVRGAQNLFEALRSGVCLVRDVGAKGEKSTLLKAMVDSGQIVGPELVLCGEPLCTKGGHGHEFGQTLDTHRTIEQLITDHLNSKYEWLKVMNGPELLEASHLRSLVEKAHQANLKVAVHAFTKPGILGAIQAKADTVEHSVVYDQETLELAKKNQVGFVPTYFCAWLSLRDDFLQTIPQIEIEYLRQWYDFLEKHFPFHVKHGLPVMAGTDAGCAPSTFADIVGEIKMLYHCGLSASEAIKSATLLPAKALGREDKYGTIEMGKWANILLLKKNPLEDINALDEIMAIWYRGLDVFNKMESPWN